MTEKQPTRDEKKRQEVKDKFGKKKILIYGSPINSSTGNGKLIHHMCKAFQSEGHQVFTIGLSYNGPQIWFDNIPLMPGFFCRICGESNKGSTENVHKIATYINTIIPDYFICVGDAYQMQQFGIGNLSFENIRTKALMYLTVDSHGEFTNERLKTSGRQDYLKICDRVISTAKFTQEQLKEWRNLDTDLIYETIDMEKVYKPVDKEKKLELRKKYRFKEDDFVIYYSGRNIMRKRPFILIDAVAKLLCETENTYLYLNIPMLVVQNEAFYPDDLNPIDFVKRVLKKKYNRDLIEEGRIIFVRRGGLGSQDISEQQNSELYCISDVLLNSSGGEGFGLTPVEANACGIPVIIPNNSTSKELLGIEDASKEPESGFQFGKGGLLTNCPIDLWVGYGLRQHLTTVENTYKALKFLYKDPQLRENLGKQGREYVLKTFNQEIFKKKWLDIIKTTKKKEPIKKENQEFKTMEMSKENGKDNKS